MASTAKNASGAGQHPSGYPRWVWVSAWACVVVTAPTIIWRTLIGMGFTLGTPASWRAAEQIPGRGVSYVLGLSAAELIAAIAAPLMLSRFVSKVPWALAATLAGLGIVGLAVVVVLSNINWDAVDPFRGQRG